jgi:aldehyde dehydrogenase (NAD+)
MMETGIRSGVVGVITAFNFPVAVWAWNAALAIVCGDSVVWKPSEKAPLTALATRSLFERAAARFGATPKHLSVVLIGGRTAGEALVDDGRVAVVSATGSTAMGRQVGPRVAQRFGRAILELGGNNAAIVCPSADLDLTLRAVAFAAMGTAGQRCTTLRRLFVHESVAGKLLPRLRTVYTQVQVGDPRESRTLIGPLIDRRRVRRDAARARPRRAGAAHGHGRRARHRRGRRRRVLRRARRSSRCRADRRGQRETFAPILYVMTYGELRRRDRAAQRRAAGAVVVDLHHRPARGRALHSAPRLDCGIANVNIGPSGAEIGGAFGGEKEPAAAASRAPTPGRRTCAAPPTRSTTGASCRWRRA